MRETKRLILNNIAINLIETEGGFISAHFSHWVNISHCPRKALFLSSRSITDENSIVSNE